MTRNEILTIVCLVLILATDAILLAAFLYGRSEVEGLKAKLRAIPGVGALIK